MLGEIGVEGRELGCKTLDTVSIIFHWRVFKFKRLYRPTLWGQGPSDSAFLTWALSLSTSEVCFGMCLSVPLGGLYFCCAALLERVG